MSFPATTPGENSWPRDRVKEAATELRRVAFEWRGLEERVHLPLHWPSLDVHLLAIADDLDPARSSRER